MDNWKGMTEPLAIGDPVRIVSCDHRPDVVGTITEITEILPPGTVVVVEKTGEAFNMKRNGYVVKKPRKTSWTRDRLYKLPPDFFETLDRQERVDSSPLSKKLEAAGFTVVKTCKRLQETD